MQMITHQEEVFQQLGLSAINPGAYAGEWLSTGGAELESENPATALPLGRVRQGEAADYERVVEKARETFQRWRMVPAPKRGEYVRKIGDQLRKLKQPLGILVSLEMGKIQAEGEGEVQEMIDIADFALGLSRQLYGLVIASERPGHRLFEQWLPLGPVGVITSFNFPVAVWSWNALIAAACGDTIIWKPSSQTPLTAIAVQNVCQQVMAGSGFEGVFNLIIGPGSQIGDLLVNDPRVPLISATGSTGLGRRVGATVSRRLGRSILELGGNNAVIVLDDADLSMALRAVLFGAVGTAGQRCTSTRRLILQKGIAAKFTAMLVEAYRQVRVGNPLEAGVLMGPLVSEEAVGTMLAALESAGRQGGRVLFGGDRVPGLGGHYVKPTLVAIGKDAPIVKEETFAPILYIIEVDDLEEAITINNAVPQGLSSSLFTTSLKASEGFLSSQGSDCGIANVNIGTSGAEIGGAFGGEKDTGGGRESGSDAWKAYMRRQTNTVNWSDEMPLAQGISFA